MNNSKRKDFTLAAEHTDGMHPTDDQSGFFARGRDFESRYVNHQYTEQEKELLGSYESVDYLPPHSQVYEKWIRKQPKRLDWDRWVMMGLIGFTTGLVGFLLHQMISLISSLKWKSTENYLTTSGLAVAWIWAMSISVLLVLFGSSMVVFLRPSAAGSGLPELIGFLNGALVRHIFNVKTLIVKFASCVCAVASGLPVGPEGPMIHIGSLIGAGVSQFKSETLNFDIPFFQRFRNPEDRRNFISAGAAAGVASAFGAPVGGLLFAMEEVSSFWSMKLSWQVFFCCMISTVTTDLFNSAFHNFEYQGEFGLFTGSNYIMFKVMDSLDVNIIMFIPTVVIGIIGGLLGALFVFSNLKLTRLRRALIAKVRQKWKKKILKVIEPCVIICLFSTATVLLPAAFGCSPFTCYPDGEKIIPALSSPKCLEENSSTEPSVSLYTCPPGKVIYNDNDTIKFSNKSFNQVATLLFLTGEEAIQHLFSRQTHLEFSYLTLGTVLLLYFTMACWSCGTHISSGLVVPMLFIGALYGRIIGVLLVTMFGVHTTATNVYWSWIDPGAFALIGAASFFGGVSRLTMSLTVIMMEITNDIQFLLPIMVAIMIAKWVGDLITHPLYHALLEVKCIPFLDTEPVIVHEGESVNLELFKTSDAMACPVHVVHNKESISTVAQLLLDTDHGGFPVVVKSSAGLINSQFIGLLTRMELCTLLMNDHLFESAGAISEVAPEMLDYQTVMAEKLADRSTTEQLFHKYCEEPQYQDLYINLIPYLNVSAPSVPDSFSLHRTYIIFRTLGLRHLTVVDRYNSVVGIITRKDLMGFKMEATIGALLSMEGRETSQSNVELTDVTDNERDASLC